MRNSPITTYSCDLSGLTAPALDGDGGDDLLDLPVGWTIVTISTRLPNPQCATLMQARDSAAAALIEQAGVEDENEEELAIVEMMADSQFAPMLEGITPFTIQDIELHIHPNHLTELIQAIGLQEELDGELAAAAMPTSVDVEEIVENGAAAVTAGEAAEAAPVES